MVKKKQALDLEKLMTEIIRALHDEDILGTAQVIEMFESAGGDEALALSIIEADAESDFEFEEEAADVDDDF